MPSGRSCAPGLPEARHKNSRSVGVAFRDSHVVERPEGWFLPAPERLPNIGWLPPRLGTQPQALIDLLERNGRTVLTKAGPSCRESPTAATAWSNVPCDKSLIQGKIGVAEQFPTAQRAAHRHHRGAVRSRVGISCNMEYSFSSRNLYAGGVPTIKLT